MGIAVIHFDDSDPIFVNDLFVHPDYRGQYLATFLMEKLLQYADATNKEILLDAKPYEEKPGNFNLTDDDAYSLASFYENKFGFQIDGEIQYAYGMKHRPFFSMSRNPNPI